jgi:hypothetical protein
VQPRQSFFRTEPINTYNKIILPWLNQLNNRLICGICVGATIVMTRGARNLISRSRSANRFKIFTTALAHNLGPEGWTTLLLNQPVGDHFLDLVQPALYLAAFRGRPSVQAAH